jgi:autoinducer 2-degrading protein
MICLAVNLLAKAGHEQEIKNNFAKLAPLSRKEPGCRLYIAHQSVDDPRKFLVYEQYDDNAALEFHRKSEHFQRYATNGLYKYVESREAGLYTPIS